MNERVNDDLDRLTDEIVASYDSDERTQRIGEAFLPSRERIVEIVETLRQLMFPGFFGDKRLTRRSVRYHVGGLITRLGEQLTEEVNHCFCQDRECNICDDPAKCRKEAGRIALEFLGRLPKLREALALDAQAAYDGDPAAKSIAEVIYCYPGFQAVMIHRVAHELLVLGAPLMPRIMSEHAHSVTGCDIHPGAVIGKSFFIDHATGVVIGETSKIGDNVKLYQGVTLGAKSFPKDERGRVIKGLQRHPTVEDDVTIYANATILGGQTVIGQGAEVGGNTTIVQSVAPHTVVLAAKAELQVREKKKA